MIMIYNLGNFKTGKVFYTESKAAMLNYVGLGYKLISVAYITNAEYLKKVVTK